MRRGERIRERKGEGKGGEKKGRKVKDGRIIGKDEGWAKADGGRTC